MSKWIAASGGAGHGSWELGYAERMIREGYDFDGYAGVSVGALFAAYLAQHSTFEEGVRAYADVWERRVNKTKDIYRTHWPSWFWIFKYLPALWKGSLFNTDKLQKTLQEEFDPIALKSSGKQCRVVAVDMISGSKNSWTQASIRDWKPIYASASYPFGFPPIKIGKQLLTDGGVKEVTPLAAAIAAGATEVDVIMVSSRTRPDWAPPKSFLGKMTRLLSYGKRILDLMMQEIIENDLAQCLRINEDVKNARAPGKRYVEVRVHRPETPLHESSLNFNRKVWEVNRRRGFEDADRWLRSRFGQ